MTGYEVVYTLSNIALLSAFIGLLVFITRYATKSRWREWGPGRSLMYFVIALASMTLSGLLVMIFGPEYYGREWVRLALFTVISVMTWRLTLSLIRIQRKGRYTPEQIQAALDLLHIRERHAAHEARTRYPLPDEDPVVDIDGDVKEGI